MVTSSKTCQYGVNHLSLANYPTLKNKNGYKVSANVAVEMSLYTIDRYDAIETWHSQDKIILS